MNNPAEPEPQRDSPAVIWQRQHDLLDAFGETHAFVGDGIKDYFGKEHCAVPKCGLPLHNARHKPPVEMVGLHKNYWFRAIHPNALDALNKLHGRGWLLGDRKECPCGKTFYNDAIRCPDCVAKCKHLLLIPGYIAQRDGKYAPRQYCGLCGSHQQPDAPESKVIYNICFKDPRPQEPPPPCERCGATTGTQLHHWAPVAIFADAWDWPMSSLCPRCHQLWHQAMRAAAGYSLPEGRRASLPTTQITNGGGR